MGKKVEEKENEQPNEFLGLTSEQAFHKVFSESITDMGNAILELLLGLQERQNEEGGQCSLAKGNCPIFRS